MTFMKIGDSSPRVDFLIHSKPDQSRLLNEFLGRAMYNHKSGDFPSTFLDGWHTIFGSDCPINTFYFSSILLFGFRRGGRTIQASSTYFLDNFFDRYVLRYPSDYRYATSKFLYHSHSQFIGDDRENVLLKQMQINGRREIFEFLAMKLEKALEKIPLTHSSTKEMLMNYLKNIIVTQVSTITKFREILCTGENRIIKVRDRSPGSTLTIPLEITFTDFFYYEVLTPSMMYTLNFQADSKYFYLDFDLEWPSLSTKVKSAYDKLLDIINKAPTGNLKVEFYTRRVRGIAQDAKITAKDDFFQTTFKTDEMTIDLANQEDVKIKVLSMIFWMMMEPNIFSVVKLPTGDNFLYMDIYGVYDHDYVQSSRVYSKILGGFAPASDYQQFTEDFSKIFDYSDILYLLGFHNPNIIDYIMDKFIDFYAIFLGGNKKTKIFDLRS